MKRMITTAFLVVVLAAPAAMGQRMEERKERQRARIHEGRESGELTKKEAARLNARERNLHREIRRDRNDGGGLRPAKRAKIERRQDRISEDVYRQKHDKQKHDAQKTAPKP